MERLYAIKHHVSITPQEVAIDEQPIVVNAVGNDLLSVLYRQYIGDYPKFFKMDLLCKVGFIASELLLQAEQTERFVPREDRAIILFNKTSSLHADRAFQATIQHADNFFPSPSVFVYTLPNIVTGEIAIRNKYYGESNFFVLPDRNDALIFDVAERAFQDPMTKSIITGWIEAPDDDSYKAELYII